MPACGLRSGTMMLGVACAVAAAADLYARKMEIVRTPEGEATVFRDSVVITDGDTRINSHMARMYESRGLAVISESVFIQSPDALIRADSAFYYLSEKRAELFGNVRVTKESLDIKAPHLTYVSAAKTVTADSGVVLENNRGKSFRVTGHRGTYNLETDIGVVDSAPVLSWARERDTARVTSERMHWYQKESKAIAEGGVRMRSGASELTCDTVVYFSGPDSGIALGRPQMKDSSSTASGDTMGFQVNNGSLEQVAIRGKATGQYRTEGGDVIDIQGREIRVWLSGGDVSIVEVSDMTSGQLLRTGSSKD